MVKKFRRYVYSFCLIHEPDGQTDGRTLHDSKDHAYASHRAVKIDDSVYTAEFLPSGYKGFRKDRTSSGAGVMVVVKDCFTALEIPMADVTGEVCWVKIDTKDNPLYVAHSIEVLLITHQNSCWNWKSLLSRSPN